MQEIAVLGIQEDRPEVLLVVIVVPQKVASELRYCRGLPDHRPRCELEAIPSRRHDRADASSGRSPSAPCLLSSLVSRPLLPPRRNRIRSARTSAVMCLFPRKSDHSRVCSRPSTRTPLPLRRSLAARSPRAPHATTSCHSVCRSRSPVRFLIVSCVATESRVTFCPSPIRLNSGSRPRFPRRTT